MFALPSYVCEALKLHFFIPDPEGVERVCGPKAFFLAFAMVEPEHDGTSTVWLKVVVAFEEVMCMLPVMLKIAI